MCACACARTIAFIVLLGAWARLPELGALILLAIKARRRAPPPRVPHLMAQQAFAAIGPPVTRRPQLVIGAWVPGILDALALRLV